MAFIRLGGRYFKTFQSLNSDVEGKPVKVEHTFWKNDDFFFQSDFFIIS